MVVALRCAHLRWFAVLCLGFSSLWAAQDNRSERFPDVDAAALADLLSDRDEVVLIDVTGTKAYRKAHIPGAIDFQADKKRIKQLLKGVDRSVPVIAYCGTDDCPAWKYGAKAARELGFQDVRRLAGGFATWQQKRPKDVASAQ